MSGLRVVLLIAVGAMLVSSGFAILSSTRPSTVPALQVEVFNACGVDGLARRAARGLQELRQDVIGLDTMQDHAFATSFVIDRRGKPSLARRLAEHVGPCPVVLERTEGAAADVTLVLGRDWESLALFRSSLAGDFAR